MKIYKNKMSNGVKKIIPAVLTNDLEDLRQKFENLAGLTDWLQIDIMDGEFVKNTSLEIKQLAEVNHNFNLEAHLMVERPQDYFNDCQKVGIKRVIFHLEAADNPDKLLADLAQRGLEKGMAINPETPAELLQPYLDNVDLILFLGVTPGKQGQPLISSVLEKVKELKSFSSKTVVELDGGIKADNIKAVAGAGVDYLVIGSAIVGQADIAAAFRQLETQLKA